MNERLPEVPDESALVNTQVFVYECPSCCEEFEAPVVRGSGEYLGMRSDGRGTLAVWPNTYANPNPVNDELKATLSQVNVYEHADSARQGKLFKAAMSVVADADVDGSRFTVGGMPRCPTCGSVPEQFHGTDEMVRQVVPKVSHRRWQSLSDSERLDAVRSAVIDDLSS